METMASRFVPECPVCRGTHTEVSGIEQAHCYDCKRNFGLDSHGTGVPWYDAPKSANQSGQPGQTGPATTLAASTTTGAAGWQAAPVAAPQPPATGRFGLPTAPGSPDRKVSRGEVAPGAVTGPTSPATSHREPSGAVGAPALRRRFRDAHPSERCQATILLWDGSEARCGRRRSDESEHYCWQHLGRVPAIY